jgi:subtilisin-like proprotein convertase family protein
MTLPWSRTSRLRLPAPPSRRRCLPTVEQLEDRVQPATFTSLDAIAINDNTVATPYPSTISVSGQSGAISKVTVTLNNFTHTFPDDVDILLVGPTGRSVKLMSDVGGGADVSAISVTFDDTAAAAIADAGPLAAGTFRPSNIDTADNFSAPAPQQTPASSLSIFNGTAPNGTWSLYVVDGFGGDTGSIAGGWTLNIETVSAQFVNGPPAGTVASYSIN